MDNEHQNHDQTPENIVSEVELDGSDPNVRLAQINQEIEELEGRIGHNFAGHQMGIIHDSERVRDADFIGTRLNFLGRERDKLLRQMDNTHIENPSLRKRIGRFLTRH